MYGPNGFGKTSFFDAVDFALTGGIGRFPSSGEPQFSKTARHLDAGSEDSFVSVSFDSQSSEKILIRNVASRKQAVVNESEVDRKSVLTHLTGGNVASADRIENFVNLFRATHLFSQEQQELMKDFQSNCQLPSQIVSRMLAFEDYANAVTKATLVRNILQDRIKRADESLREFSEQIINDRRELDRLARVANNAVSPDVLGAEAASLSSKLAAVGISLTTDQSALDAPTVRGWRASVEASHAQSQSRSNRLFTLAGDLTRYPQLTAEITSLRDQSAQKEQSLTEASRRQTELEADLARLDSHLNQVIARRSEEESRAASLQWVRANQPAFAQLLQRQGALNAQLQAAVELISRERTAESTTSDQKRVKDTAASEASTALTTKSEQLLTIKRFAESVDSWISERSRLAEVVASEGDQNSSLALLRGNAQLLAEKLLSLKNSEERLSRQLLATEATESELRNLLSQLQTHVSSGICLACGDDHGTKEELLSRMRRFTVADSSTANARSELGEIRASISQVEADISENKQKQDGTELRLRDLGEQRERSSREIGIFESLAATLGFSISEAGSTLKTAIRARQDQIQLAVETLSEQAGEAKRAVEIADYNLRTLKNSIESKINEAAEKRVALAQLEADIATLLDDPRQISVPLNTPSAQLDILISTSEQDLAERREETSKAEYDLSRKRPDLSSIKQEVTALKSQLATLRSQSVNVQRTINEIDARFREYDVPLDIGEDALQTRIVTETRIQAHLLELRNATSNLELALDTATTAAALTQLQHNLRAKEAATADASASKAQCEPWLRYFDGVIRLVSTEQNKAIANFTRAYGPRASVIQARLRPVYGFEEVEMQTRDAAITVRVRRRGEELKPTDYFSQSQQQTLLLALFLTAATSQTWSGFCPILLDDPVTHFDDLNVYSFLDLIAGLLESERGRRQFIICTCDQKLMKLARQKFRNCGSAVVFYKFSDIGTGGPTVEEISFA